ncbi:unnamed protein product [Taenia asiatica]|uniref:F5/8 type C domain-containing protein n=1 Tax=Taenia asiatica TaxID=60517 RepID=A0A0R3WFT9_TAEAS|nr:unnamed protein product [Taenia asiatica]
MGIPIAGLKEKEVTGWVGPSRAFHYKPKLTVRSKKVNYLLFTRFVDETLLLDEANYFVIKQCEFTQHRHTNFRLLLSFRYITIRHTEHFELRITDPSSPPTLTVFNPASKTLPFWLLRTSLSGDDDYHNDDGGDDWTTAESTCHLLDRHRSPPMSGTILTKTGGGERKGRCDGDNPSPFWSIEYKLSLNWIRVPLSYDNSANLLQGKLLQMGRNPSENTVGLYLLLLGCGSRLASETLVISFNVLKLGGGLMA